MDGRSRSISRSTPNSGARVVYVANACPSVCRTQEGKQVRSISKGCREQGRGLKEGGTNWTHRSEASTD